MLLLNRRKGTVWKEAGKRRPQTAACFLLNIHRRYHILIWTFFGGFLSRCISCSVLLLLLLFTDFNSFNTLLYLLLHFALFPNFRYTCILLNHLIWKKGKKSKPLSVPSLLTLLLVFSYSLDVPRSFGYGYSFLSLVHSRIYGACGGLYLHLRHLLYDASVLVLVLVYVLQSIEHVQTFLVLVCSIFFGFGIFSPIEQSETHLELFTS